MKTWIRLGLGVGALAFAIAVGTAAYAMHDDESAAQPKPAAVADDASGESGSFAQQDTSLTMICVAGSVDCNDTPGMEYGDFGDEEAAKCAADGPGCFEPTGCPPEGCTASSEECVTLETDDPPIIRCTSVGCGYAPPPPGILVDPVPDPAVEPGVTAPDVLVVPPPDTEPAVDPSILVAPAPDEAPPVEPIVVGEGCLGEDPCTISSTPVEGCLPPDCSVSSDGAIVCPSFPPCDLPMPIDTAPSTGAGEPDNKPLPAEQPCATEPCIGGGPAVGAPDGVVVECVSPPSAGAPGASSDSSGSGGGSVPVQPPPDVSE